MDFNTDGNESDRRAVFSFPAIAHFTAFVLLFANLAVSPWLYDSWEIWWFWPMFTLLVFAGFFSGVGALVEAMLPDKKMSVLTDRFRCSRKIAAIGFAAAPFMLYAVIRAQLPSDTGLPIVAYQAEKSLMIMISPLLIAFVSFFSLTRRRLRILCWAVLANIVVISVYGAITHLFYTVCDSDKKPIYDIVLWTKNIWYLGRAKGTFYVPNHFSAFVNIGICLFTAMAFTPIGKHGKALIFRSVSTALALALFCINILSLSRGGIFSLFVALVIGIPLFAMRGYKSWPRIAIPAVLVVLLVASFNIILKTDNPFGRRAKGHNLVKLLVDGPNDKSAPGAFRKELSEIFWYKFDRGEYIASALRAWKSNPVWGIGPGQHEHRWPEFAPTPVDRDGNPTVRPANGDFTVMRRPRLLLNSHFVYEVHSDWTQLLEEYGLFGFLLFLVPVGFLSVFLWNNQTFALRKAADTAASPHHESAADNDDDDDDDDDARASPRRRRSRRRNSRTRDEIPWGRRDKVSFLELSLPLAALLSGLVIAIHSFGDFSLQMPAITWVFSFILAAGILTATRTHR